MSAQAPTSSNRMARLVIDDLEGVLDPDVVAVTVPEAVCDGPSSPLRSAGASRQRPGCVVRMQHVGPALRIRRHFLRRIPHDRAEILGDKRARVDRLKLRGVDDRGADGEEVLQPLARRF